jgi:hypothetical protein
VAPWEEIEEVQRPTQFQKKRMFTVFFNGLGQYFTNFLPEGRIMDMTYYSDAVIAPLSRFCYPGGIEMAEQPVTVHFVNAPMHNTVEVAECLAVCGLNMMCHVAYSPDLARCDFFLSGHFKRELSGRSSMTVEQLSAAVHEILRAISPQTFLSVFEQWAKRLEEGCRREGNYVE